LISRYAPIELEDLWSDKSRFGYWFRVEMAACAAMEDAGIVPKGTVDAIGQAAEITNFKINPVRIGILEAETRHDVVAFLRYLEESFGQPAKWLHFGLTSSDVVDTALAMMLSKACLFLDKRLEAVLCTLALKAREHAHTAMVGRTHGQHAEPTTFGLVLASHHQELDRAQKHLLRAKLGIEVGTMSGAVGTYAQLSPDLEETILRDLELRPEPIPTQVVARDRHAALFCAFGFIAAALERLALTIRHLQRTEVAEVREGFSKGQTGSSAMPHKRNPIASENLCGLARYVRGAMIPAMENVALWHERDISHSSVERLIAPDVTTVLAHMLDKALVLIKNLEVDADQMARNLQLTGGFIFSESVMLALVRSGMDKKRAYQIVQRCAMEARTISFKGALLVEPEVVKALGVEGLEKCFDLKHSLRHVDTLIARAIPEIVE